MSGNDQFENGAERRFSPIVVRTRRLHRPVGPFAQDCVDMSFVRAGPAELFGSMEHTSVAFGDVVLICPGQLCGVEPDDPLTLTTALLDTDYAVNQVFWQHADLLCNRHDALGFAETLYTEPVQVLRLGEDRAELLLPWLDELVALSVAGQFRERFNRMQTLWFAIADVLAAYVTVSPIRILGRNASEHGLPLRDTADSKPFGTRPGK